LIASVAIGACSSFAFGPDPRGVGNRKIILSGIEFRQLTPEDYLDGAAELDKTPADGVVIHILKNPVVGRDFDNQTIMSKPLWTREKLADLPPLLRKMGAHRSLRHSFLKSLQSPAGGMRHDWRDDAAWAVVASNMAAVAWLAREGGLPGLSMDVEDYPRKRQFWRIAGDPPFAELKGIARQRGREVFKAVFDAYPDVTILAYFGFSELFFMLGDTDPLSLESAKRDLYPSFLNGILDVMTPNARFVDGVENSYRFSYAKRDFIAAKTQLYNWYLPLVAPENRRKFLSQYKTGFALYMDMYVNPHTESWYNGPIDGSRLEHLRRNAAQALSATDEYVWMWCERGRWVDWGESAMKRIDKRCLKGLWSEMIPGGLHESLLAVKDPARYLYPAIDAAVVSGTLTNLVANPGFEVKPGLARGFHPGVLPSPFRAFCEPLPKEYSEGEIGIDATSGDGDSSCIYLRGTTRGCARTDCYGLPSRTVVYILARVKGDGAWPSIAYSKAKRWLRPRGYLPIEPGDPDEWRTIRALVRLPDDADGFTLMLGGSNLGPDEIVRYDNVRMYIVPAAISNGVYVNGK